ncbi:UNVERIFIED_CONTAM: hypothetical protein RMT77_015169 [Armadillidium vulgare]
MDFKHETEIKDEILEFTEDDGKITHCLDQVLRNDELQERNYLANINIKGEIEVKDEPFDIVEAKEEFLCIDEDSMIDEVVEPSSAVDENQRVICDTGEEGNCSEVKRTSRRPQTSRKPGRRVNNKNHIQALSCKEGVLKSMNRNRVFASRTS